MEQIEGKKIEEASQKLFKIFCNIAKDSRSLSDAYGNPTKEDGKELSYTGKHGVLKSEDFFTRLNSVDFDGKDGDFLVMLLNMRKHFEEISEKALEKVKFKDENHKKEMLFLIQSKLNHAIKDRLESEDLKSIVEADEELKNKIVDFTEDFYEIPPVEYKSYAEMLEVKDRIFDPEHPDKLSIDPILADYFTSEIESQIEGEKEGSTFKSLALNKKMKNYMQSNPVRAVYEGEFYGRFLREQIQKKNELIELYAEEDNLDAISKIEGELEVLNKGLDKVDRFSERLWGIIEERSKGLETPQLMLDRYGKEFYEKQREKGHFKDDSYKDVIETDFFLKHFNAYLKNNYKEEYVEVSENSFASLHDDIKKNIDREYEEIKKERKRILKEEEGKTSAFFDDPIESWDVFQERVGEKNKIEFFCPYAQRNTVGLIPYGYNYFDEKGNLSVKNRGSSFFIENSVEEPEKRIEAMSMCQLGVISKCPEGKERLRLRFASSESQENVQEMALNGVDNMYKVLATRRGIRYPNEEVPKSIEKEIYQHIHKNLFFEKNNFNLNTKDLIREHQKKVQEEKEARVESGVDMVMKSDLNINPLLGALNNPNKKGLDFENILEDFIDIEKDSEDYKSLQDEGLTLPLIKKHLAQSRGYLSQEISTAETLVERTQQEEKLKSLNDFAQRFIQKIEESLKEENLDTVVKDGGVPYLDKEELNKIFEASIKGNEDPQEALQEGQKKKRRGGMQTHKPQSKP